MCEFVDGFRGIIEPMFAIGLSKCSDIFGHHQHLFNFPWEDDIISKSVQKLQPPRDDQVLREDEVFWGELPELLRVIYLPCLSTSTHKFIACCWYGAVC